MTSKIVTEAQTLAESLEEISEGGKTVAKIINLVRKRAERLSA